MISIQREPVSAVSSDINFPMKGRRGMKDWARSSEDKLFIPREVLSLTSAGESERVHGDAHGCVHGCAGVGVNVRLGLHRGVHGCEGAQVSAHLVLCACMSAHLGVHVCVHV